MKLNTTNHPKFRKLQRLIDQPTFAVVGILEGLWMLTSGFADDGNLSRFSPDEIADSIGWTGDANALVEALVDCRWLDRENDSLHVHDWLDHCPHFVVERHRRRRKSDKNDESCNGVQHRATSCNVSAPSPVHSSQFNSSREKGANAPGAPSIDEVAKTWNGAMAQQCRPTPKRKSQLAARLKDSFWRERWREGIQRAANSEFCRGQNDRGWKADLEFFLRPDTLENLLNGKYGGDLAIEPQETLPPAASIADRRRQIATEDNADG